MCVGTFVANVLCSLVSVFQHMSNFKADCNFKCKYLCIFKTKEGMFVQPYLTFSYIAGTLSV